MRVPVMLVGHPQPAPDQVELLLRRGDTLPGLLLEGVQDIDRSLEPDRVHRPEGVAVVTRHHLQDAGAEALERFGVAVPETCLGLVDRKAHAVLYGIGEPLQILTTCSNRPIGLASTWCCSIRTIGVSPYPGKVVPVGARSGGRRAGCAAYAAAQCAVRSPGCGRSSRMDLAASAVQSTRENPSFALRRSQSRSASMIVSATNAVGI